MSQWDFLLEQAGFASVLTGAYAKFAHPVQAGLATFLAGLPEAAQAEILSAQAQLPATARFSQRLVLLARSCPVLHKLGQILARDARLPLEFRLQLQQLESLPPQVPVEAIQERLSQELGPLSKRGITLAQAAIAEASVAVVIPYQQQSSPVRQGVFKVLKPGIQDRLNLELVLLEQVGEHLDERCDQLQIPHLDYHAAFQQVREKLQEEVNLEHEQSHLKTAGAFYAGDHSIHIPQLFEHCTPKVTSMERIFGQQVTHKNIAGTQQGSDLAKQIVRGLIAAPLFSQSKAALFHADPHAGNLFLTHDNRLALLDWSLTGSLGDQEREAMVQLMLGAVLLDSQHICRCLSRLHVGHEIDVIRLNAIVESWLQKIRHGGLPGFPWLTGLMDDVVQLARVRFRPDLVLFRKSIHTLEGVVADVSDSTFAMNSVLFVDFLREFAREWPRRWTVWPGSRQFATRLSNWDLSQLFVNVPSVAARFWTGCLQDLSQFLGSIRREDTVS